MPQAAAEPLHLRLDLALDAGPRELDRVADADPVDRRDEALTLLGVHDLHLAPIGRLGDRARWQHHPAVARLKLRLEGRFMARLGSHDEDGRVAGAAEAVAAVRAVAARDQVPGVYRWVAEDADACWPPAATSSRRWLGRSAWSRCRPGPAVARWFRACAGWVHPQTPSPSTWSTLLPIPATARTGSAT